VDHYRARLSGVLGRMAARIAPIRPPRPWLTEVNMTKFVADKALWLNADRSKVVEEGSPDAAFLLASKGKEIDAATAERYGLGGKKTKAEDKAVRGPKE
jgi:hypothetical protein